MGDLRAKAVKITKLTATGIKPNARTMPTIVHLNRLDVFEKPVLTMTHARIADSTRALMSNVELRS